MNPENSIEHQEKESSKIIFTEVKEHLEYSTEIYNFCFKIRSFLNQKLVKEVGELLESQMMILMRITDFLRCIQHTIFIGYPEQAGTLAASIFELTHTAIYFSYDFEAMQKWRNNINGNDIMPKLMGKKSYTGIIKFNYEKVGLDPEPEISVYKQLCWMKHSHPIMQGIQINNNEAQLPVGPHTDEKSFNHAWFSLEHSGRLTEMLIVHIVFPEGLISDADLLIKNQKLNELAEMRNKLNKKAQERFNNI